MGTRRGVPAPGTREAQTRLRVAQEAGRLMAEEGIHDFAFAKRKALERLGLPPTRNLPSNQEIEAALIAHQQLFRAQSQPARLHHLRRTALEAMRMLAPFSPRLVGPVLAGTADQHSPVHLHVFADTPEQLDIYLMERGIPYTWDSRQVRLSSDRQERYPACQFMAGDVTIELTVFPPVGLRQAPLSPIDGKPLRRVATAEVEQLLDEGRPAP